MSKESQLAELMSKDKDLVRRVSGIEVEEITLTKKGALGDEADAVLLFKEDGEAEVKEANKEEVAELEKEVVTEDVVEDVVEETAELEKTVDSAPVKDMPSPEDAIALLKDGELSDEQKEAVLDLALGLCSTTDLTKADDTESVATESSAVFPEEAMNLLKSMSEALTKLTTSTPALVEDEVVIEKDDTKPEAVAEPKLSVLQQADQLLRKSLDDKKAQGRALQDADVLKRLGDLAEGFANISKLEAETRRTLDRACGKDA